MTSYGAPTKSPPLYRQAYTLLRRAIIDGALKPNETLPENDLARRLGISRTPLREALRRLQAESLLRQGNDGWYVPSVDLDDVLHVYACRLRLEPYIAGEAARLRTLAELEAVRSALGVAATALDKPDVHGMLAASTLYHRTIAQASRNSWALKLLDQSWAQISLFRAGVLSNSRDDEEHVLTEHWEIFRCLEASQADAAAAAMEVHLRNDMDRGRRAFGHR